VQLFWQAAELLNHPHLQPYILKIHLKLNNPRRSTYPFQWSDSNYVRRTRFVEPDSVSTLSGRGKRLSFSNDRALNPSISGTEVGSVCSTQRGQGFSSCSKEKHYELSVGCVREECNSNKSKDTKSSTVDRIPRFRTAKEYATPRRQTIPSKASHTGSKRDLVSSSSTLFSTSICQVLLHDGLVLFSMVYVDLFVFACYHFSFHHLLLQVLNLLHHLAELLFHSLPKPCVWPPHIELMLVFFEAWTLLMFLWMHRELTRLPSSL